jgi:tripartite-type tricarboxylate transporter receptor subunit TctC
MDPAVREKLAAAFAKASQDPLFLNLCNDRGIEPAYLGPADFEQFATQQAEYFAEQIPQLLGMRP